MKGSSRTEPPGSATPTPTAPKAGISSPSQAITARCSDPSHGVIELGSPTKQVAKLRAPAPLVPGRKEITECPSSISNVTESRPTRHEELTLLADSIQHVIARVLRCFPNRDRYQISPSTNTARSSPKTQALDSSRRRHRHRADFEQGRTRRKHLLGRTSSRPSNPSPRPRLHS